MKQKLLFLITFTCFFFIQMFIGTLFSQSKGEFKVNWKTTPFYHRVFIENKGQFTAEEKIAVGEPILFYSEVGKLHLYFTQHSVVYRYDSIYGDGDIKNDIDPEFKNEGERKLNVKVKHLFFKKYWEGTDSGSTLEPENPVSNYFTYKNPYHETGRLGIEAHAWNKLVYHNLYNGIDVEFTYPKPKRGISYQVILHPGADSSRIDRKLNLNIGNWDTATGFNGYNVAYDLHYDNMGNVYVYGGKPSYQLEKYDSTGKLLWTYTTVPFRGYPDETFCGDFTVDERSGSCYIVDGLTLPGNVNIALKLNASGILVDTLYNGFLGIEMWKVSFDYCDNLLVVGSGDDLQALTMDTNLLSYNAVNVLNTQVLNQDICLLALDLDGNAYMATEYSEFNDANLNNLLLKVSLPTLSPTAYMVSDGYGFNELISLKYYPPMNNGVYDYPNGFNGMAADKNMVVTSDGQILKKWKPASGALQNSKRVSNASFEWGGIDIDCADNIYVGVDNSILIYDSSLVHLETKPLPDTVYDVRVGNNRIYACGVGFVSSYYDSVYTMAPISVSITKTNSCSACSGAATANIKGCTGNISSINYVWSNGKTTQTVTGLCPGSYSVAVNAGCILKFKDTVTITSDTSLNLKISLFKDTLCQGSAVSLSASGASSYSWSPPSGGLSCINCPDPVASPTTTITYTVTGFDTSGCFETATATINVLPKPVPVISALTDSLCKGSSVILNASGLTIYSWHPSGGLSCNNCPDPVATPTATITYILSGIDSNICMGSDSVTIKVFPLPVLENSHSKDSICLGDSISLTINGANSYSWNPPSTLSCDNCKNPTATPDTTTTYTIVGMNTYGCKDSTTIMVMVSPAPDITITSAQTICQGDSVNLNAKGGGKYLWSNGSKDSAIIVNPVSNTTYTVIVTKGCSVTAATSVTVLDNQLIVCCDTIIISGNSVTLHADSSYRYKWTPPADLSCDTCPVVSATPSVTTTYTITGTNSNGCITEKEVTVFVECNDFTVPNVFTPGYAGINGTDNVFYIKAANGSSWSIIIYDRWGKVLYKSSNPSTYWDGNTPGGAKAPDGVYFYIITSSCHNNGQNFTYDKKGFVQLIR